MKKDLNEAFFIVDTYNIENCFWYLTYTFNSQIRIMIFCKIFSLSSFVIFLRIWMTSNLTITKVMNRSFSQASLHTHHSFHTHHSLHTHFSLSQEDFRLRFRRLRLKSWKNKKKKMFCRFFTSCAKSLIWEIKKITIKLCSISRNITAEKVFDKLEKWWHNYELLNKHRIRKCYTIFVTETWHF